MWLSKIADKLSVCTVMASTLAKLDPEFQPLYDHVKKVLEETVTLAQKSGKTS